MKVHEFSSEIWLPLPPEEIFPFFADAANLDAITPPWLSFRIATPPPITMREGALIDYRLKVRGIPLGWRTRINVWEPPHRFEDEQLRGPYR
ncbi:MAG: SRPBCC family protein, partial [Verrucomicrobiia bacterium]